MAATDPRIEVLMQRVAAGELDALTADEVALLEKAVDADAELADRLAAAMPPADEFVGVEDAPSDEAWERVWSEVAPVRRKAAGWWWQPIAAAAAVALMVGTWQWTGLSATPEAPWRLGGEVEVLELETFEEGVPMVMSVGDAEMQVIWIVGDEG